MLTDVYRIVKQSIYADDDLSSVKDHRIISDVSGQSFDSLLNYVIKKTKKKSTLLEAVDTLATLDGRIAENDAFRCLTEQERDLIERFGDSKVHCAEMPNADTNASVVVLVVSDNARLAFQYSGQIAAGFRPVVNVEICDEDAALLVPSGNQADDVVDHFLTSKGEGELLEILNIVEYHIDHIDPVILHVGGTTFTNFDKFNNLLARPAIKRTGYVLTDLRSRSVQHWSDDEKVLVTCVYMLSLARIRVEEFNGHQINLPYVEQHMRDKYQQLCDLVKIEAATTNVLELPQAISDLRERIRPTLFAYRSVNGLMFNKHEFYLERSAIDLSVSAVPRQLTAELEAFLGCKLSAHQTIDGYFAEAVSHALGMEIETAEGLTPFERLLELVVRSAIARTSASIGMTRGVRDLKQWKSLFAASAFAEICELPSTDYYCAVFAEPQAERELRDNGQFNKVMAAIAQRMTFNSWHYTPGHVPIEAVPEGRHFYTPPKMSDLAIWSDRHHQGHILAKVRYSVRSPGGMMINGRKQHGLYDLRLMRSDGEPFEMADLICARRHTAYLRAILQAALDSPSADPSRVVVQSFTKKFYKNA